MKKGISIGIYFIGICMVIFFAAKALIGGNAVVNPEAMIPFTEFERNSIFLGIGFIPMVLSCIFLIYACDIKTKIKRILVFTPGIITGIPFVVGAGMIIIMMFLGLKNAILG
ncbi:hypothetical protein SAMN06296386_11586 [Lachnospiraceae bacterium]|nr:hypothetical protein SAMN06296386_11586 [Lachnospiraceae bacterium]